MRERASLFRPSSPRLRKGRSSEKPLPRGPGAKTGSYPNLFGYRAASSPSFLLLSPPRHHLLFSQAFLDKFQISGPWDLMISGYGEHEEEEEEEEEKEEEEEEEWDEGQE